MRSIAFHRLTTVVGALLLVVSTPVWAKAPQSPRFPTAHVTASQIAALQKETLAKVGAKDISQPSSPDVTAISVPAEQSIYYFTKPGPAYPAAVLLHVVSGADGVSIIREGYFAGDEAAFARWFAGFDAMVAGMRAHLGARSAPP